MKSMTGSGTAEPVAYSSRWEQRDAQRKANAKVAREAAQRRASKPKASLVERVEAAKVKLEGVNVAGAIALIQAVSPQDYDIYLLAEQHGQARRGVVQQFGAPRGTVERAYLEEVGGAGLGSPEDKE